MDQADHILAGFLSFAKGKEFTADMPTISRTIFNLKNEYPNLLEDFVFQEDGNCEDISFIIQQGLDPSDLINYCHQTNTYHISEDLAKHFKKQQKNIYRISNKDLKTVEEISEKFMKEVAVK